MYTLPVALPEMTAIWQETLGWQPTPFQQAYFQQLYEMVLQANQQLNLTRITTAIDFWEKHLWDALRGIQPFLAGSPDLRPALIDIGTGAGFPGLPIAIVQSHWQVTLVDSTRKKMQFVQQAIAELGLNHAAAYVDRAEAMGQVSCHREQYDYATIRAVAEAAVCAEYTLPLLKQGGWAILYRGQWTSQDTANLMPAVDTLGGKLERVESFVTPVSHSSRACLYIRKVRPTPRTYPRGIGLPTQQPLT
jgi:16S rRNA (guanine527-N7)-methyltransferase